MKTTSLQYLGVCALLTSIATSAFAQNHVGGGNRKELQLRQMMVMDLIPYLESKEGMAAFPKIVQYNLAHPKETISDLFRNTAIVFKDGPVLDGFNGDRDCVSHFENPKARWIECNNNAALDPSDLQSQPALYAFLFHEILVQAEIEKPWSKEIPSVYTESLRMKFHKETYEKMVPGEENAQTAEESKYYSFYEGLYVLVTPSKTAKANGLKYITVQKLRPSASAYTLYIPLLSANDEGLKIVARYSATTKLTAFDTGLFDWCQDYGCAGISTLQGHFVRGPAPMMQEKLFVTASFFKANRNDTDVDAWEETLEYKQVR